MCDVGMVRFRSKSKSTSKSVYMLRNVFTGITFAESGPIEYRLPFGT